MLIMLLHNYTYKKYVDMANSILAKLKDVDPQYELNGMRNMWILKPSELCCGTGISISHNLKDIFRKIKSRPKDYFIVQKYIGKYNGKKNRLFDRSRSAIFPRSFNFRTSSAGPRYEI